MNKLTIIIVVVVAYLMLVPRVKENIPEGYSRWVQKERGFQWNERDIVVMRTEGTLAVYTTMEAFNLLKPVSHENYLPIRYLLKDYTLVDTGLKLPYIGDFVEPGEIWSQYLGPIHNRSTIIRVDSNEVELFPYRKVKAYRFLTEYFKIEGTK